MPFLFSLLAQLIGYVCVATVLMAILGFGFLWHTGKITNEKAFNMYALIHDIDVQKMAEGEQITEQEKILPEEPSLRQLQQQQALFDRNYEIKKEQLSRQIAEFRHVRDLLASEMARRDTVAQTLDARLSQAEEDAINEGNLAVARHFNSMKPQQVKDEMMKMIDNDQIEAVIPLLNTMSDIQMKKVLQQFRTDADIATLYELHNLMMEGYPKTEVTDQIRKELQELED